MLTAFQRQEALTRLDAGETQADIARSYGVDATTIGRLEGTAMTNEQVYIIAGAIIAAAFVVGAIVGDRQRFEEVMGEIWKTVARRGGLRRPRVGALLGRWLRLHCAGWPSNHEGAHYNWWEDTMEWLAAVLVFIFVGHTIGLGRTVGIIVDR
jgi:hypothetical protein